MAGKSAKKSSGNRAEKHHTAFRRFRNELEDLALGFNLQKGVKQMEKYVCQVCGYVYDPAAGDPDNGVNPGTAFADIPADWVCPVCGADKDSFSPE